ncbi:CaiB/BaiF CoA transferase family protein [Thalassotalea euphylliae]|uniref:CaiB/BaiF CoA transferase family protein n=1 Tax=Thalassotalea euphylliae TaxID=1655234 RepID=UPI00362C3AAD
MKTEHNNKGPLSGIKVLDLSRILAGPWSTQVLADYGATVWKIERPERGDDTRQWGPPFLKNAAGEDTSDSAYYLSANRGKQSITADIASTEGQTFIKALVKEADIVVENFKVGGLKRYGLDYESLKAVNPSIIYCSITGFGQTGPYAEQAGYDAMIQAMGGLMSITGEQANLPGGDPQRVGVAVADLMTGMYAVSGILAALHHRNNTGEGQHIDIALLDTMVAFLANQGSNYLVSGEPPTRMGTAHPNIVPYQAFAVKDGHILLAVGNDNQFKKCCEVMGVAELAEDSLYATNASRVEHRENLVLILSNILKTKVLDEWLTLFNDANVPCGPINTLDRVFENPQVIHRNMQFSLSHPEAGQVPLVANPVNFSVTKTKYHQAPPTLGQHTEAIKTWLSSKDE